MRGKFSFQGGVPQVFISDPGVISDKIPFQRIEHQNDAVSDEKMFLETNHTTLEEKVEFPT